MRNFRKTKDVPSELVIRTEDGLALARVPPTIRQQVRYLWTRVQVHDGDVPHSIGVTSQLSGEGVSFTARAVAAVLARLGRTCLVEANWWGQGVPLLDQSPGLAGVLLGNNTVDEVLISTDHPGLSILPCGESSVAGQAVMADTDAVSVVLDRLRQRFDYVIVDLPAISTSATALSFAAATDASLLVVRQRVTAVDQVERAVADLRHTRLLGVVLNGNRIYMPKFLQRRLLDN